MKNIIVLGSTGSIGTQTLDVIRNFPGDFHLKGISAGKNIDLVKKQITEFKPDFVVIQSEKHAKDCDAHIKKESLKTQVSWGQKALVNLAEIPCDLVIVAIVGTASLLPTYKAIQAKNPIALACKEVLVSGGHIITNEAKKHNTPILPIDSEHAALKQCLAGVDGKLQEVNKLILTASGGPFWNTDISKFSSITRAQALKHPNWTMGAKITIDSATLMNKGLEIIEAHHLFDVPYDKLDIIIHPQSIIHSLVEFTDGTILSQMGLPDMRFPIQYAMSYPEKWENPWPKTRLSDLKSLDFHDPDYDKFPLLKLAFETGRAGDCSPAILNAANEAYVHLFLEEKIGFMDIMNGVQQRMESTPAPQNPSIEDIIALDTAIKEDILSTHT